MSPTSLGILSLRKETLVKPRVVQRSFQAAWFDSFHISAALWRGTGFGFLSSLCSCREIRQVDVKLQRPCIPVQRFLHLEGCYWGILSPWEIRCWWIFINYSCTRKSRQPTSNAQNSQHCSVFQPSGVREQLPSTSGSTETSWLSSGKVAGKERWSIISIQILST